MTEQPYFIPPKIAEEYEFSAVLKEEPEREVLLLQRNSDGQRAVLKRMDDGEAPDRNVLETVRALDVSGVPKILEIAEHDGAQYILREYVEGKTLLELLEERGPLPVREAAGIGVKICAVLERLHGLDTPIIHRDIKAENVVLTPDGRCALIDFGIARFYNEKDARDTRVIGSSFAAAPEQFGYTQTDPRSDIYSMGVLLFELSTGEYALDKSCIPAPLKQIVKKCTRFDPADRYQSAARLKKALLGVVNRPRRVALALSAAVAAVLAVTLLFALRPTPVEPRGTDIYTFASPELGAEVARQLGKDVSQVTRDDLALVTEIRLIGDQSFDDWNDLVANGEKAYLQSREGEELGAGTVSTLEDIRMMPNLEELALCCQNITDLTPLAGTGLYRLALHSNGISDLTPLVSCENLQELIISGNPVSDLTPLTRLPVLWRLNISATEVEDMKTIMFLPRLTRLEIGDCPKLKSLDGIEKMPNLLKLTVGPVTLHDLSLINNLTELDELYVWSTEEMDDLSAISNLKYLISLSFDFPGLKSLDGIEEHFRLHKLAVKSDRLFDPKSITGIIALEVVDLTCFETEDWTDIVVLWNLESVTVRASDAEEVERALQGRNVYIAVAPD